MMEGKGARRGEQRGDGGGVPRIGAGAMARELSWREQEKERRLQPWAKEPELLGNVYLSKP